MSRVAEALCCLPSSLCSMLDARETFNPRKAASTGLQLELQVNTKKRAASPYSFLVPIRERTAANRGFPRKGSKAGSTRSQFA